MTRLLRRDRKDILWWGIGVFLVLHLCLYVFAYQYFFLRPFDVARMGKIYSYSPYIQGSGSKVGIGDDGLYAFAAYYYTFDYGDVSSVNFEHPPLGKYLIGMSLWLTGNENAINIVYLILILWVTYRLARLLRLSPLAALLSILVLSYDALFLDHLQRSLLDLPFTLCFMLSVYFFLSRSASKSPYVLANLFFAGAFAIRFYPFALVHYVIYLAVVWYWNRKQLQSFLLSSLLIPLIYLVVHTSYFIYHPSIVEFLRHKKWMLAWFTGSPRIIGNIWWNVYLGSYLDATGGVVRNALWRLSMPIIISLGIVAIPLRLRERYDKQTISISLLVIAYLLYTTVLTNGNEKFLMPIYPLLCILAIGQIHALYSIIRGSHGHRAALRN